MSADDPRQHNYLPKLLALQQQGKIPAGRLTGVEVSHDDWCAFLKGGRCDCDPDVRIVPGSGLKLDNFHDRPMPM
jgi:hypothetical protein